MKITDSPYSVGTPEHSEWVKEVLIPAQGEDEELIAEHSARAGAESIGANLIHGDDFGGDKLHRWLRKQMAAMFNAFATSMEAAEEYSVSVNNTFNGIVPVGIILDEGGVDVFVEDHKQHQKRIKQTCIPHGKSKSSCRKCNRR